MNTNHLQMPSLRCITTVTNNCASNPCKNGATCTNGFNAYACQCVTGYTASTCASRMYIIQLAGALILRIWLYCVSKLYMLHVRTVIDNCASSPCKNSGLCSNGLNMFTCSCLAGYTDSLCGTGEHTASVKETSLYVFLLTWTHISCDFTYLCSVSSLSLPIRKYFSTKYA